MKPTDENPFGQDERSKNADLGNPRNILTPPSSSFGNPADPLGDTPETPGGNYSVS